MNQPSGPIDILILGTGPAAWGALQLFSKHKLSTFTVPTGITEAFRCQGYLLGESLAGPQDVVEEQAYHEELEKPAEGLATLEEYNGSQKSYLLADTQGQLHRCRHVHQVHSLGDLSTWFDGHERYGEQGRIGLIQLGEYRVSPYPAKEYNQRYCPSFPLFHDLSINFPAGNSPYSMTAELLHDERMFLYFLTQLQDHQGSFDLFLLPPILGLSQPLKLLERLKEGLQIPVAELLSPRNGPAGHRLHQSLRDVIQKHSVTSEQGKVASYETNPNRVITMVNVKHRLTQQDLGPKKTHKTLELSPRVIFLATGGVGTGGVVRDLQKGWMETSFHLPWIQGDQRKRNNSSDTPHDCNEVGLLVDQDFRPTNGYQEICYQNLFAAGTLVQKQFDRESGSLQMCRPQSILDGVKQGQQAARQILKLLSTSEENTE